MAKSNNSKKAPAEKAKANSGRVKFPDDGKITLIAKENPRRKGSKSHQRFDLLRSGMTVGEYLKEGEKLGADVSNLATDVKRGAISISK